MRNLLLQKLIIALRALFIVVVAAEWLAIASATGLIIYLRHQRPPCIEKQVIRLASEDNTTDAVLRKEYCGRTYRYKLYFVPSSAQVSSSTVPVIVKSGIHIINAKWLSPNEFLLEYEREGYLIKAQEKKLKYNLTIRKN